MGRQDRSRSSRPARPVAGSRRPARTPRGRKHKCPVYSLRRDTRIGSTAQDSRAADRHAAVLGTRPAGRWARSLRARGRLGQLPSRATRLRANADDQRRDLTDASDSHEPTTMRAMPRAPEFTVATAHGASWGLRQCVPFRIGVPYWCGAESVATLVGGRRSARIERVWPPMGVPLTRYPPGWHWTGYAPDWP